MSCNITVDVRNLGPDVEWEHKILLHTNSSPMTYSLTVQVRTAAGAIAPERAIEPEERAIAPQKLPYGSLVGLFITFFTTALVGAWAVAGGAIWSVPGFVAWAVVVTGVGAIAVDGFGAGIEAVALVAGRAMYKGVTWALGVSIGVTIFVTTITVMLVMVYGAGDWAVIKSGAIFGAMFGFAGGAILESLVVAVDKAQAVGENIVKVFEDRGFNKTFAVKFSQLTAGLGVSLGIGLVVGLLNPYIMLALAATGLPLGAMILCQHLNTRRRLPENPQSEQNRIKLFGT